MPRFSATFSIRAVRREKRFSTSAGIPAISKSSRFRSTPKPNSWSLSGQPNAKGRLEIRGVPLEFAELAGFPAPFLLVPGRVEHEDMGMQLRIGKAVNGPRRGVDEFRPDHVARGAVRVLAAFADAGFHLRFHFAHRLIDGRPERTQDVLVAAHGVEQRDRLRHREREIVTHRPLAAGSHRQRLSGCWVEVVAQPLEGEFVHRPFQAQAGRPFAAPRADDLLSFAVIIRRRVIPLGVLGTVLLRDTNHASFYRITNSLTKS